MLIKPSAPYNLFTMVVNSVGAENVIKIFEGIFDESLVIDSR